MSTFPNLSFPSRAFAGGFVVLASALVCDVAFARNRIPTARSFIQGHHVEGLATDSARPADQVFLEKAVTISRLQLRLAEVGASQATSTEVRSHAEQLKSDNRQLLDATLALRQRKGNAMISPADADTAETYTRLSEKSGAEFDREFIRLMSEVHESTINAFEQAAADSKDTDVRSLAAAQLPMLRAHRNRIAELRKTFE